MPVRVTVGPNEPTPAKKPNPKPPASNRRRRNTSTPTPAAPPRRDAVAANDTITESEDTE